MTASPYIAVVGGVNIDIGGRSDAPLVAGDSNPGRIRSSLGGVGRNIAHNLALLGAKAGSSPRSARTTARSASRRPAPTSAST